MSELTAAAHTIRPAEQMSERWFYGGGVHRWLATSEDTGGTFLLFSDVMQQGKRTPLHTHPADESMYVIDGQILVHLGGEEHRLGAGGLVIAPREVPHAFLVLSETATLLTLHTPGTCQAFYLGASEPLTPDTDRVVDFERVRASARDNGGINILGPPPFAHD
jgi:quercetin dioxygenase-like cupin family protein